MHTLEHHTGRGGTCLDHQEHPRIMVTMELRQRQDWTPHAKELSSLYNKRLLRNTVLFAAVSFCLGLGIYASLNSPLETKSVMSHLTAGFEYDETLGRLQFVSNLLPESAMVFLSDNDLTDDAICTPVFAEAIHVWNADEPWIEYAHIGDVFACRDGEIMTIVQNHEDEYTVRMMHEGGYESVYSGLNAVHFKEHEEVAIGQAIGTAAGFTAFELRKDGMCILPDFASL